MNIRLKDFLAKAIGEGLDLTGSLVQCGQQKYQLTGLDSSGRVEILYGINFETPSRLNDWINIYGLQEARTTGGILSRCKKGILIFNCNNPQRA